MTLAISLICAIGAIVISALSLRFFRQGAVPKYIHIIVAILYVATLIPLLVWASTTYQAEGPTYACFTYLMVYLVLGAILSLIQIPKSSRLYYIPLAVLLLAGCAFIFMEVELSIRIFQPNR